MREVLADGERHSFLEAKSKKKVRKPPIKRKEKPLVDLPLTDKVPEPPRLQNDGIWHKPFKPMLIEKKIEIARNDFEINPKWMRQTAARAAAQPTRHTSPWLASDLRNVPPPERPMSSSYRPRFRSGKLNFTTGAAKSATHQLEETKMLYYAPLSGSSHTSALEFRASLRTYPYLDDRLFKKMKEKQMEKKARRELQEIRMAAEADGDQDTRSQCGLERCTTANSRDFLRGDVMEPPALNSPARKPHALKRTLTFRTEGGPAPVAVLDNPAMHTLHPVGLQRIASRSQSSSAQVSKIDMAEVIQSKAPKIDLIMAQSDSRAGTPHLKNRRQMESGRGQQQIILGLANSEIRDKYHDGGQDEVDKLLATRFARGESASGARPSGTPTQAGHSEDQASAAAADPSPEQAEPMGDTANMASIPEDPVDNHEEVDGDAAHHRPSETLGEQQPGQDTQIKNQDEKERDGGELKFPPCSKDASIFKRLVYNTVPKEEIPDTKPAWLSYCVHDYTPPEPEEDPLLRIARLSAQRSMNSVRPGGGGGAFRVGQNGKQLPRWKKGARPVGRELKLPPELKLLDQQDGLPDLGPLSSRSEQPTWAPRMPSPGTEASAGRPMSEGREEESSPKGGRWQPKHFSNDIYISNLRIRQAEQLLTPLHYGQQQARGHG